MKRVVLFVVSMLIALPLWAKTIPIEDFFKRPNFDSVRISPTGEYLAARIVVDDKKTLVVMDRATLKILRVFNFGNKDNQEVGNFGWLNDERVFANMVVKLGPLDQPAGTGYMFAANVDGKKSAQIMPKEQRAGGSFKIAYGFNILNYLPEDPENIIVSVWESAYPVAYKVNVYTGSRVHLGRSPVKAGSMLTDTNGELRIAVGMGDTYGETLVYLKPTVEGDWELLYKFSNNESGMRPIAFTTDQQSVLLRTTDTQKDNALYKLDITSKALTKIKEFDGDADIEDYIVDSNYGPSELLGVVREPGYRTKEFINAEHPISKLHMMLDDAFKGQFVDIVNYTKDGKTALVYVYSDKNPGTLYTLETDKLQLKELMTPRNWLAPKDMADRQPISFKARDGLEIRGYLTLPKGKSKNLPMVLVVHGGPYGPKDGWYFDVEAQFLANRGYAVLQLNYRGSGGRGSNFEYSAYRQMGMEMQDDLTDGTLWAVEQGIADKDRLCIYGGSYGGYAALYGVVKEPDLYKCAIGYVGVYDIAIQTKLSDTAESKEGRQFLEDAWDAYNDDFVKERSALYHLDKLKAALFIVHGDDDQRVPVENAHALTEALDDMKYPYELMIKNREGHGFYDEKNQVELYNRMEAFLKKHIGN